MTWIAIVDVVMMIVRGASPDPKLIKGEERKEGTGGPITKHLTCISQYCAVQRLVCVSYCHLCCCTRIMLCIVLCIRVALYAYRTAYRAAYPAYK